MDIDFYKQTSFEVSKLITQRYSTSFSLATSLLKEEKRKAIYAVYGFVRLADEIVDSLHNFDKPFLLDKLKEDMEYALEHGISTNPVLVSFAETVKKYNIAKEHIDAFMQSMEYDLTKSHYNTQQEVEQYIYGSADVVGLMCLKIFCNGEEQLYNKLEYPARKLGSAFQKVNFIRDLKDDLNNLGRSYFPEISYYEFNENSKIEIEKSIKNDFDAAWVGLKQLPGRSKLAVALAYYYYKSLFRKIKNSSPEKVLSERIRISNLRKYVIIVKVGGMYKTRLI